MAIVNKGFPGTVNATEYAKSWHLGGADACDGTGWLVTQGTGRQTSTAAGDAFAAGVLSTNSAPILTSLSTPVAGQWFLIVRRIDWAGAGTVTVEAVAHTTTSTTIPVAAPGTYPTINESPGVLYDHKLSWAWVRNTDTTMVRFDLRELPLEPRMQVLETSAAASAATVITNSASIVTLNAGTGRGTGSLFPTATPATLDAISTAAIGDLAMTVPAGGVDPLIFMAVAGSGVTIDWRLQGTIYSDTKAHLDTATTTMSGIVDIIRRIGDFAYAADTAITYRWDGSAWKAWSSDWIAHTPSLSNIAIGTGGGASNTAFWRYENGRIRNRGSILLGTSGSSVSGSVTVALPTNATTLAHPYVTYAGIGTFYDTNVTTNYFAFVCAANTSVSTVQILSPGANGLRVGSTASVPFTWAAGDVVSYDFVYDPA